MCARLEHVVAVEYFDFVRATASRDDQVSCVLLELGSIYQTGFLGRKAFVPRDVLNRFAGAEVPELELFVILVGSSQKVAVVEVDRVSTDVGTVYRSDGVCLPDIPDFHIVIPTS